MSWRGEAAGSQLADYKVPEFLQVVDAIPRNAQGKADRKALLAMTNQTRPRARA